MSFYVHLVSQVPILRLSSLQVGSKRVTNVEGLVLSIVYLTPHLTLPQGQIESPLLRGVQGCVPPCQGLGRLFTIH